MGDRGSKSLAGAARTTVPVPLFPVRDSPVFLAARFFAPPFPRVRRPAPAPPAATRTNGQTAQVNR